MMEELTAQFAKLHISSPITLACISFTREGRYVSEAAFFAPNWSMRHAIVFHVQVPSYHSWNIVKDKLVDLLLASSSKILFVYSRGEEALMKSILRANQKQWTGSVYNLESITNYPQLEQQSAHRVNTIATWVEQNLMK